MIFTPEAVVTLTSLLDWAGMVVLWVGKIGKDVGTLAWGSVERHLSALDPDAIPGV